MKVVNGVKLKRAVIIFTHHHGNLIVTTRL